MNTPMGDTRNTLGYACESHRPFHPVVQSVIRVFAALQVATLGITAVAFLGHDSERHATIAIWAMLALCSGLLAIAMVPRVLQYRFSLPLMLIMMLGTPAVGQALALLEGTKAFEKMALEQALFLAVPLVIVAWQYSFRSVVGLSLAAGLLDIGLALLADIEHEQGEVYLHVVLSRTVGLIIAGYVVSRLVGEQRQQHGSLERANEQLRQHAGNLERLTVSRERNRMARELHDTLAHTLSAMAVQLEAVRAVWNHDQTSARSMIDHSLSMAREGLAEVRRTLQALRASPLEDLGLSLAIRSVAESMADRTGVKLDLDLPDHVSPPFPGFEQGLFRIAQEAIENVERHACATKLSVQLSVAGERWKLTIEDDGLGFEPDRVPEGHFGLRGIRERAELLGGDFDCTSQPGQGTRLAVRIDRSLERR